MTRIEDLEVWPVGFWAFGFMTRIQDLEVLPCL